jgi:hypothetical protein
MPEPTDRKPKYFFTEYASYEEWDNKPPLPPPDRPVYVPREWAGHIGIAIAHCLAGSLDGVDLDAMRQIGKHLLELHPGLENEVVDDGIFILKGMLR